MTQAKPHGINDTARNAANLPECEGLRAVLNLDGNLWQGLLMNRHSVIAKLREHEPELKAAGIVHLRLHGSVARGDDTPGSDVDLIAEFDAHKRLSLLDMVGLENRLGDLLGVRVDLSPAKMLKEPVRFRAEHEAVIAF
jgi:hypothetical protein